MPYTEQDLRDAQIEKLRAEIRQIGKPSWHSHTYWIAICTGIAAVFSTIWQSFRSDTEYKLAQIKTVQAELDQRELQQRVATLKVNEEDLRKKREVLSAAIAAAEIRQSEMITQAVNLQDRLDRLTGELAAKKPVSEDVQNLSTRAKQLAEVAKEGAAADQLWFVYLTTDDDPNAEAWSRKAKDKLAAELRKVGVNDQPGLWRKDRRWAISVGDALSEDKARELVNRLYQAGYKQAARSLATGWTLVL